MKRLVLLGLWATLPVLAQPGANADCPTAVETAQRHLLGTWQAQVEGSPKPLVLELVPHPEYAGSVRGHLQRDGARIALAGDVHEGGLTLEESVNDVNISAAWLGDVVEGSCGREIHGEWRAEGAEAAHRFVLRKQ